MSNEAITSPTIPPSIPLTFGQFYTWPAGGRSSDALGGLISNDAGNVVQIAVRVIPVGGSTPSGTPALLATDYVLTPGASIAGIGLAPPGTSGTSIQGIYLFPVQSGSPRAWLSDVLSECPPAVVPYGGIASAQPVSSSQLPSSLAPSGGLLVSPPALTLSSLYLLGVSASPTASGYFVDLNGNQVGTSFSGTILLGNGTNNPQTLAGLYGTSIPAGAIGVYLHLGGNIYWAVSTSSTDFKANYARYPQLIADPQYNTFGTVAQ